MKEGKHRKAQSNDPMYQRALAWEGVYGVQLFDFSRTKDDSASSSYLLRGGGYWVPREDAKINPNIKSDINIEDIKYSTTHSVAIFALGVRSNKTPWPKGNSKHKTGDIKEDIRSNGKHLSMYSC